jgi:hypothetical protein
MRKVQWPFLFALLVLLVSACGTPPEPTTPTAKLTLAANPSSVVSGNTVTLTATIDEGAENVASVEFAINQDVFFTDDNAEGGYTAVSAPLTTNTTFVAIAKNTEGTVLGTSNEASVTVTAPPLQPNAEAKTVTTLAGVAVAGGTTPTGIAVTTEKLVVQNGSARLKGSATGGTAVVNADGTFSFTPASGATAGSFEYEVFSGTLVDSALVTFNITPLPANAVIVNDLASLTAATAPAATTQTIIVAGTVTCEADQDPTAEVNCVVLKTDQTLLGSGTVAGIALTNPNAKLTINLPGTNTDAITGIKLASGVTIEGLEISGEGTELFTAIVGQASELREPGSPAADPVPSTVTIKNVRIVGPTANAPFSIKFSGPPAEEFEAYYNLNIDGLTVTDVAANPIGISAFSSLEFRNSNIAISASASGETGVSVRAYSGPTTAIIDNVTITSAKGGASFSPLEVGQSSAGGILTVTVKNSTVTFADEIDKQTAAFPFYFNFGNPSPGAGKIVISAESTGNTSNTTSSDPIRWTGAAGKIEGTIELNGTNFSRP